MPTRVVQTPLSPSCKDVSVHDSTIKTWKSSDQARGAQLVAPANPAEDALTASGDRPSSALGCAIRRRIVVKSVGMLMHGVHVPCIESRHIYQHNVGEGNRRQPKTEALLRVFCCPNCSVYDAEVVVYLWLWLQGIQADPPPLIDVGMEDGSHETDTWRFERISARTHEDIFNLSHHSCSTTTRHLPTSLAPPSRAQRCLFRTAY